MNLMKNVFLLFFALMATTGLKAQSDVVVPPKGKFADFYKKEVNANGIPVISSDKVSDAALLRARTVIGIMLSKRDDIRKYMADRGCKVMIIGQHEEVCDLPEYAKICDTPEHIAYWNKRARGFGGAPEDDLSASFGEENVLALPGDRYEGEDIMVHEFAHLIQMEGIEGVEPGFGKKLEALYQKAKSKGLWQNTYAMTNKEEYFAEGVQSFFNCNRYADPANGVHNAINTRDKLKKYDPELYKTLLCYFPVTDELTRTDQQSHAQEVKVPNVVAAKTVFFPLSEVRLLDSPFTHAMTLNAEWMLELSPDRLLANFRTNAGLTPKAPHYDGWENMGIAGHTLGHYLTAAAQQYAATGDVRFKMRVDYIVNQLDSCQIAFVNGFIGGMPGGDKVFKEVKKGIIRSKGFDLNGLWVPWYNEHKTMMGLSDAYLLCNNSEALTVLTSLAGYLADVVKDLPHDKIQTMLLCEYGGMNEAFAQVYALTGDKKFLDASYIFYQNKLQDKLAEGVDALQGLHSNTNIPKLIGSAREYELTGNDRDRRIAQFGWETLVHHHSYANGGNSLGEYLYIPDHLNDRLGTNTTETCNTYNMLKLTGHLYEWSADPQYMDYYERALYNHILASQHPEDGRTTYFLSLGMGTQKNFGSKEHNFSCCMGSGFENHSKYGGAIYSHTLDNSTLNVNLFIPSILKWKEKAITLRMETAYPDNGRVRLYLDQCAAQTLTINLRYPAWAKNGATIRVNGAKQKITAQPGSFVALTRQWKKGDRIEIDYPMSLYTVAMPDNPDRRAIFYGPCIQAGVFGTARRNMGDIPVFVNVEKDMVKYVKKVSDSPVRFATLAGGAPKDVTLEPFYHVHDQYQTVYWDVYSPAEWKAVEDQRKAEVARLAALDAKSLDYITFGEMQPERDHNLEGIETRNGEANLRKYRYAYENGWFAFDMKCGYDRPTQLVLTYHGGDTRKYTFDLSIGDWTIPVTLDKKQNGFVEHVIDIPLEVTKGKDKIRVTCKANDKTRVTNLYNCRLMKK